MRGGQQDVSCLKLPRTNPGPPLQLSVSHSPTTTASCPAPPASSQAAAPCACQPGPVKHPPKAQNATVRPSCAPPSLEKGGRWHFFNLKVALLVTKRLGLGFNLRFSSLELHVASAWPGIREFSTLQVGRTEPLVRQANSGIGIKLAACERVWGCRVPACKPAGRSPTVSDRTASACTAAGTGITTGTTGRRYRVMVNNLVLSRLAVRQSQQPSSFWSNELQCAAGCSCQQYSIFAANTVPWLVPCSAFWLAVQ